MTRIRIAAPKSPDFSPRRRTQGIKPPTQTLQVSRPVASAPGSRLVRFSFDPPRSADTHAVDEQRGVARTVYRGQGNELPLAARSEIAPAYALSALRGSLSHPVDPVPLAREPEQASEPGVIAMVNRASKAAAALDADLRSDLEGALHVALDKVRVHTGPDADRAARQLGALAFTIDDDVFFRDGAYNPRQPESQRVIAHEVAHTVQATNTRTSHEDTIPVHPVNSAAEREADAFADEFMHRFDDFVYAPDRCPGGSERDVDQTRRLADMPVQRDQRTTSRAGIVPVLRQRIGLGVSLHPAEKALKYAAKWLAKRETRTITKHIARHARRIAGRAVHSVFKQPRQIKGMVERAVQEAVALAAKNATKPAREAIEEAALRITYQATGTPGKIRWIVQKTFREAIGTQGERILRIIIDQSGRVVSAFPTDRLIAIGLGVGTIELLGERSATAAERARDRAGREAQRQEETSWWDFVPLIGDLWGGSLNAGEDEDIRLHVELQRDIQELVLDIEHEEGRQLTAAERLVVGDTYRAAIAVPLMPESDGKEIE